MKQIEQLSW